MLFKTLFESWIMLRHIRSFIMVMAMWQRTLKKKYALGKKNQSVLYMSSNQHTFQYFVQSALNLGQTFLSKCVKTAHQYYFWYILLTHIHTKWYFWHVVFILCDIILYLTLYVGNESRKRTETILFLILIEVKIKCCIFFFLKKHYIDFSLLVCMSLTLNINISYCEDTWGRPFK